MKNILSATWKERSDIEKDMLELEASCLTSTSVLEARAQDGKVRDILDQDDETVNCYKANHLLADTLQLLVDNATAAGQDRLVMTAFRILCK